MEIRRVSVDQLHRVISSIDRSEHVDVQYEVVGGALRERPVVMTDIPDWFTDGDGEHSVTSFVAWLAPIVERGASLHVAFDGATPIADMVIDPDYDLPVAWFASLHVSRSHRRTGVAGALWDIAVAESRAAGATTMYVSASSTGSAVGFYLSRGCVLADPPRPELFEHEPEDIHLVLAL